MNSHPAAMSSIRILRVAELLRADHSAVAKRAAQLPSRITAAIAELPVGTLLTLELQRPWWDRRPRTIVLRRLERRLRAIAIETERVMVVAAALIVGSVVLVAQRSHPVELAGQWEFPGGKVERGESAPDAMVRECAEELGCTVVVEHELARQDLADGALLVLYRVALAAGSAEPRALEHREIRWAAASDLGQLTWVGTNQHFITNVISQL